MRAHQNGGSRSLNAAYAGGLLSEDTFVARLDLLLRSRLVDPGSLVGDLSFRRGGRPTVTAVKALLSCVLPVRLRRTATTGLSLTLLALDWSGDTAELLVGRDPACDVVLPGVTVSRHHARVVFRDGKWILHDLGSTNGSAVNGTWVGRCELCPGDQILLGEERLTID